LKYQKLTLLGSTGSIGTQTLDIVRQHADRLGIEALSANSNWKELARQINEFRPKMAVLCNENYRRELEDAVHHRDTKLLFGEEYLKELATLPESDTILNSLVGFVGFIPTVKALKAGKKVALANKESLVVGGEIITDLIKNSRDQLVPIDSEHSAMLQCLVGESPERIEKIVITASGGPFRTWSAEQMKQITVEEALNHPNWSMGAKITVDSATMMNKGLEIIETHWLFDVPLQKIEAVVHPQSVIHSMITFVDGSSKAQLGPPNMKVPIQYALTYPDRMELEVARMDWTKTLDLTFEPVDYAKFPCLKLAREALETGGSAPAVLNASNEIAVKRFLNGEIAYIDIANIVESSLTQINSNSKLTIESLQEIDQETRKLAQTIK